MLDVGTLVGVPADGPERDCALAFRDRVRLPPQIGQSQTPEDMALSVVRCGPKLLLECEPGRVGVDPRLGRMPAEVFGLRADDRPGRPIVVEGTGGQCEELLLLGVIQYPVEVSKVPEEGD